MLIIALDSYMRSFREFFASQTEAAAPRAATIPKGTTPPPAHPGYAFPNLNNPMPFGGHRTLSGFMQHQHMGEKPDLPVLSSLERLVTAVASNPAAYSNPSMNNGSISGIPYKLVVAATSLSLGGDGKMTGNQFRRAQQLGIITHPSRKAGLANPNDYFDLDINNLRGHMQQMQQTMDIRTAGAQWWDTLAQKATTASGSAQPLQRSQWGV